MLSFLTTAFVAALLLVEVSGSATCSGTPGLATVKLQEASKLQEEHSDAYLLSEEDEEFELPELELPKTMQPPMPPAILTRAWTLPYLTELPTPLPDLLVLLVALASFSLFRKLRDVLSDACEAEPVQRQTRQREETDAFGCTALHRAAFQGSSTEVRRLLEGRSDPNAREAWDETPLHMAARSGNIEAARLLIAAGASIDAVNADDKTPLFVAGEDRKEAMCDYLLKLGATAGGLEDLPTLLRSLMQQNKLKAVQPDAKDSSEATD